MNEKIFEQTMKVRATGRANMLDIHAVQRIAFDSGFYELVNFIEENKADYVHFIMTGEVPKEADE